MLIITISTLFNRIDKIKPEQFPIDTNIRYVVSCQGKKNRSDTEYESLITSLFGDTVIWGEQLTPGLSNNRNNAIKMASDNFAKQGYYIYICDDDVTLVKEGLLEAINVMKNKNLACLTAVVGTETGFFKNYKSKPYKHTKLSIAKVSSIEILADLDFINSHKIQFDARFGLGSKYPSGEEFIFLNDIITKKGRVIYYPAQICTHPPVSSGSDFYTDSGKIIAKGAMLSKVFSFPLNYIMILAFSIKKHKIYQHKLSLLKFLRQMLKGSIEVNK